MLVEAFCNALPNLRDSQIDFLNSQAPTIRNQTQDHDNEEQAASFYHIKQRSAHLLEAICSYDFMHLLPQ